MDYYFGKEKISVERWVWGVLYKDGIELHQFEHGLFRQIKEIDWDSVKLFSMYKFDNPRKRIDLVVSPEMQLFHFYRNIKPFYMDGFVRVYVFGYKIKGSNTAVYHFILPDDRVVIADKDNIDLALFELNR